MQDDLYIDTPDGLQQLCDALLGSDYIALFT